MTHVPVCGSGRFPSRVDVDRRDLALAGVCSQMIQWRVMEGWSAQHYLTFSYMYIGLSSHAPRVRLSHDAACR